jgi:hypothetical protein
MFIMQFRQRFTVEADIDRPDVGKGIIDNLSALAGLDGRKFQYCQNRAERRYRQCCGGCWPADRSWRRVQAKQFDVGVVVANVDFNLLIGT